MAKCRTNAIVSKISNKKLDRETEVDFTVIREIEACAKINTSDYVDISPTTATAIYNRRQRPEDELNCLAKGCYNSGTLYITAKGDSTGATFVSSIDAHDVYAGVIAYYIHVEIAGFYKVTTAVGDIRSSRDKDVYEAELQIPQPGYYPILVDLATLPKSITGLGWMASEEGVEIDISVVNVYGAERDDVSTHGLSSIQMFNSIEDLEANDVIKISCIESIDGDYSFDTTSTACLGVQYDNTESDIEKTIEGSLVTGNYQKLNPFHGKGDKTESFEIVTIHDTVKSFTYGDREYGYIRTTDMFTEECGFTYATLDEKCNITDAILVRLSSPTPIGLSEHQFLVLDGTKTSPTDSGIILFNPILIGETVTVSYPKRVKVRHFEGRVQNKQGVYVKMSYKKEQSDGLTIVKVFPHVLITEFPDSISNSGDDTFSFSVAISPVNGKYYDYFEIEK